MHGLGRSGQALGRARVDWARLAPPRLVGGLEKATRRTTFTFRKV